MASFGEFSVWHKFYHPNVLSLLSLFGQPEFYVFMTPLYKKSLYAILKGKKFTENSESFDFCKKWMGQTITVLQ